MNDEAKRVQVLHVDDDSQFAELAATFLERENERFAVETATSASEGLDALAEGSVDCVVSDYEMPGRDGIEFLDAVRERYGDLPFILFTGRGSEEIASEAISAGVTDYLQKGGTEQYTILANRIENGVAKYRAEREIRAERDRRTALFTNNPHPIVEVEFDGRAPIIRAVNPAFEEIFGFDAEAVTGRDAGDVVVPDRKREEGMALRDRLYEGETVRAEVKRQTAEGTREFLLHAIPFDERGGGGAYAWYVETP